jgi:TolB protein
MAHKRAVLTAATILVAMAVGASAVQMAPARQAGDASTLSYMPLIMRNRCPRDIAFSSRRDGNFEIYTLNPCSLALTRVAQHEADDVRPAWGGENVLAWASRRYGNWEIVRSNVDGSDFRRLTSNGAVDYDPTWSPDGLLIAFSSDRSGGMDIWRMDAQQGEVRGVIRLTSENSQERQPAWSPDGRRIAYTSDQAGTDDIWVMRPDGSGKTRLTLMDSSRELFPAWSADSQWVVFTSDRDGGWQQFAIHVTQATLQPVRENPGLDAQGSWSPDGQRLVFRSTVNGNTDLYWLFFRGIGYGQSPQRLTSHSAIDTDPAW